MTADQTASVEYWLLASDLQYELAIKFTPSAEGPNAATVKNRL